MKKNNFIYYFVVIILLSLSSINFYTYLRRENKVTPEEIFKDATYSVVEVKASSNDVGESFGSAVFISKDGSLITNAHVVTYKLMDSYYEFENIQIRFAFENDYRTVSLIKYDLNLDISILKLNDTNCEFKPIAFADSKSCESGNVVYAVGNLNNVGISMTKGIVSNPNINIEYNEKTRNVIQCDLVIADGNSGGALLNESGELLGITTFRLKDASQRIIYGICYCIPANAINEYINK